MFTWRTATPRGLNAAWNARRSFRPHSRASSPLPANHRRSPRRLNPMATVGPPGLPGESRAGHFAPQAVRPKNPLRRGTPFFHRVAGARQARQPPRPRLRVERTDCRHPALAPREPAIGADRGSRVKGRRANWVKSHFRQVRWGPGGTPRPCRRPPRLRPALGRSSPPTSGLPPDRDVRGRYRGSGPRPGWPTLATACNEVMLQVLSGPTVHHGENAWPS